MTTNEMTVDGHVLDWIEDEDDPGTIGVWLDSENPIGRVWMTDHPEERWMAETHFGGGFAAECDSFDDALRALLAHAQR